MPTEQRDSKLLERKTDKKSKIKTNSRESRSQISQHTVSKTIKDCTKIIQKRKKEQEMEWNQKWENSK